MIHVVLLKGDREKEIGLMGMRPIPTKTLFVFPNVRPGTLFHSRGVYEPFDIAFLDGNGNPIEITEIIPPDGLIAAPPGTMTVVEAKAGTLVGFRGFHGLSSLKGAAADLALPIITAIVGSVMGYAGYKMRGKPVGSFLLGSGSIVVAVSIVVLLRNLLRPESEPSSEPTPVIPSRL